MKVLFSQLDYITCLALAACLTPTDPTTCAAIVGMRLSLLL
jgi:NhaP-type Na+/H+ or K+/H+ antiporter